MKTEGVGSTTISTQERSLAPQPDRSAFTQMQEYNSATAPSSDPNSSVSHPYRWGDQYPARGSYATHLLYPGSYHLCAVQNHPNAVGGLAFRLPEAEGMVSNGTDWESMRKCTGSLGRVGLVREGERSGESAKKIGSSRIERDIGSGIASTSYSSDKAKHKECPVMKKRSFGRMLANEANVENENTVSAKYGGEKHQVLLQGNKLLSMRTAKGDRGISSKGFSLASKFMMKSPNKPFGASEPVESAKMVAREKVMTARQIQEREEIEAKAKAVRRETSMLAKELASYSEMCLELKEQNDYLWEELKMMYEENAFSALEAKDSYHCLKSVHEDNNGRNQESSNDLKSSVTDPSTPDA